MSFTCDGCGKVHPFDVVPGTVTPAPPERADLTCVAWGAISPGMNVHHDCPVILRKASEAVPGCAPALLPALCPCECRTCKRAWEAMDRPTKSMVEALRSPTAPSDQAPSPPPPVPAP